MPRPAQARSFGASAPRSPAWCLRGKTKQTINEIENVCILERWIGAGQGATCKSLCLSGPGWLGAHRARARFECEGMDEYLGCHEL